MSEAAAEPLRSLAHALAWIPVVDLLRAACVSSTWNCASERLEAWSSLVITARRPVDVNIGLRVKQPRHINNMLEMDDASMSVLMGKMRRVGQLHGLSSVPPPSSTEGPKRTHHSPLQLRRNEFGQGVYWWLCYNTDDFGWFDKDHTTTYSTGLKVWAPCPLMCRWFSKADEHCCGSGGLDFIAGRRVLELGAGIGMLGSVIARHAREVFMTDIDTVVLRIAAANARGNGLTNVKTIRLPFGRDDAVPFREAHGKFDHIVGADIIYTVKAVRPMFESAGELLTEDGILSLGFVDRDEKQWAMRFRNRTRTQPRVCLRSCGVFSNAYQKAVLASGRPRTKSSSSSTAAAQRA
mmetsp:Transcript_54887/g.100239  ORF Transcript_54887/g.100239 Transcript_54887/m.100239 type:complete len:351 (+) Transcript_54887:89-1141(+)